MGKIVIFDEKPIVSLFVLFLSFLVISFSSRLDIYISNLFFDENHFLFKNNIIFNFIDKYFPYITIGICFMVFIIWAWGLIGKKYISARTMTFLCGTMFVGPILIVNGLFKSFWGRARPKDILEFGGDKIFSPAMVISDQCKWDCSFVSGHTAVAFWFIALALTLSKSYRNICLLLALAIGIFVGFVRIAQGYHFFSDVFFSAVITTYVIWVSYYYLFEQKKCGFLK